MSKADQSASDTGQGLLNGEVVYVGRQPIFDRDMQLHAFELLHRSGGNNEANVDDGNKATARVFINTFMELGLDVVTSGRPAFINLTEDMINGDFASLFPPDRIVVEVLEDVEAVESVVQRVAALRDAGYRIALDDFEFRNDLEPLIELADIVKLDVMELGLERLKDEVDRLEPFGVRLLAEKIETAEELEVCQSLGFEYFQGYVFGKPRVFKARANAQSRLTMLELLAAVNDPKVTVSELEQIVRRDVSLSYRLLRYINSAAFSLCVTVESVMQGLLLLGKKLVRTWVNLVVIAGLAGEGSELLARGLVRARMCEILAREDGRAEPETAFTIGMFSIIDSLMGQSMEDVLHQLPFTEEVESALLRLEGDLGGILNAVLDYESGDWEAVDAAARDGGKVRAAYVEALSWTAGVLQVSKGADE